MNGYQGTKYSTVISERNEIFKPLVASTVQQVLDRKVVYSVVGRGGELKGTIIVHFLCCSCSHNSLDFCLQVHHYLLWKLFSLM